MDRTILLKVDFEHENGITHWKGKFANRKNAEKRVKVMGKTWKILKVEYIEI